MLVYTNAFLRGCSSVDRVLASEAKGRGFDPRQPRHLQFISLFDVLSNFLPNKNFSFDALKAISSIVKPLRWYYYRLIGNTLSEIMATVLTVKGQVTIPKNIRDALGLTPGTRVDFGVNKEGQVVILKAQSAPVKVQDRFESVRGKADIKWRTKELMALLRGDD